MQIMMNDNNKTMSDTIQCQEIINNYYHANVNKLIPICLKLLNINTQIIKVETKNLRNNKIRVKRIQASESEKSKMRKDNNKKQINKIEQNSDSLDKQIIFQQDQSAQQSKHNSLNSSSHQPSIRIPQEYLKRQDNKVCKNTIKLQYNRGQQFICQQQTNTKTNKIAHKNQEKNGRGKARRRGRGRRCKNQESEQQYKPQQQQIIELKQQKGHGNCKERMKRQQASDKISDQQQKYQIVANQIYNNVSKRASTSLQVLQDRQNRKSHNYVNKFNNRLTTRKQRKQKLKQQQQRKLLQSVYNHMSQMIQNDGTNLLQQINWVQIAKQIRRTRVKRVQNQYKCLIKKLRSRIQNSNDMSEKQLISAYMMKCHKQTIVGQEQQKQIKLEGLETLSQRRTIGKGQLKNANKQKLKKNKYQKNESDIVQRDVSIKKMLLQSRMQNLLNKIQKLVAVQGSLTNQLSNKQQNDKSKTEKPQKSNRGSLDNFENDLEVKKDRVKIQMLQLIQKSIYQYESHVKQLQSSRKLYEEECNYIQRGMSMNSEMWGFIAGHDKNWKVITGNM